MHCHKNDLSLWSPETAAMRSPRAFKKVDAEDWVAPCVLNATGWNMCVAGRLAYLANFLLAAASAAPPADWNDKRTYESARVLTTVTSHVNGLPACQGMRVSPSGRLPSVRVKPKGSLVTGTPAAVMERAIASLMAWCLIILLGAFLHTKP